MSLILDGTNGLSDVDGSASTPAIRGTDTNTGIFFPTADTIAFAEGGAEVARFDSSGNLGIGTTSPTALLDVFGGNSEARLTTSLYGFLQLGQFANGGYVGTSSSDATAGVLRLGTANSERMRIDSSGALLVGKTSSDITTSGLQFDNNSGNSGRIRLTKSASGSFSVFLNYHSGTYVGGIDISNTATSFPTSSDIRLKKDIVDASSATEKIDQIRIVSHGWKHDDSMVEFGVIAQELYTIAPQAVTKGDDGEEIEKTWGVDYSKLVPMLLKAHQEQQAIITEQSLALNELKTRIEALEQV
jgi:hypothetical protein